MRVIRVFRELDGARYGSLAALQPILEIGELDNGVFTRDTTHNSDINDPFDVVSSYEAAGNSGYSFGPTITPTARFVSGVAVFVNMGFVRDFITNPNADIIEAATIGFNYPGIQIISSAPFNISNATKVVVKSTIQSTLFANRKVSIPIVVEVQDASSNPVLLAGVAITLTGTNTTLTGTLSGVTNASGVVTFSNVIPSNGTACDMAAAIVVSSLGLTPFTYNTVILQKEIIKPRRSEVTGAVPLASELDTYEMAINLTDKKIFAKKSDGSVVVVAGDPPDMTNANTAYTERRQWDGGATNLNATTARVSLGLVPGVDVQGFDSDLQAISLLASGTGLLKKTGNVWSLDSSTYITGNSGAINAATLNSQGPSYYLDYNNLTNKPSSSGGDASTLNSQPASYYLNYTNLTNKPTSITSVNATAPLVSVTTSGSTVLSIPLATTTVAGYMSVAQATSLNTVTASTTQNRFYASPATAAGVPTFRNILASDIPILNQNTTGNAATATSVPGAVYNATHTGDAEGSAALVVKKINGVALSGLATGILKNTTATGIPSIAIASDFPILNQNTTGNASTATLASTATVAVSCSGNAANVTGIVAVANGGTGVTSKTGTGSTVLSDGALLGSVRERFITLTDTSTTSTTAINMNINLSNNFYWLLSKNVGSVIFTNLTDPITSYSVLGGISSRLIGVTLTIEYVGPVYSIAWPSTVKWKDGTAPYTLGDQGKKDVFIFMSHDNGATWLAFVAGQNL